MSDTLTEFFRMVNQVRTLERRLDNDFKNAWGGDERMTHQINGMVRERLTNCDTHFENDQIEAVMEVLEQSGYPAMYEALKLFIERKDNYNYPIEFELPFVWAEKALAKAERK